MLFSSQPSVCAVRLRLTQIPLCRGLLVAGLLFLSLESRHILVIGLLLLLLLACGKAGTAAELGKVDATKIAATTCESCQ